MSNPIFTTGSEFDFRQSALNLYLYQRSKCEVFAQFCNSLGPGKTLMPEFEDIVFMPVSFFKSQTVKTGNWDEECIFTSSSTTGTGVSRHFVKDLKEYSDSFNESFRFFYGNPKDYCFLCLLPSYLERSGSSLIYMANEFVENSKFPQSGFFLSHIGELTNVLLHNKNNHVPTILLGVAFALMDMAESFSMDFPELIVMETGGMKGRRKEPVREEIHNLLKSSFGVSQIHSEYGMTELLSQAYSKGNGVFQCPPWMKIIIKDPFDPYKTLEYGKTGAVNIIDLANQHSCAFIATRDLGRVYENGSFEILGRFDNSDLRGCNLLIS